MILNVSGRTDIVAFYTDWFFNRYREGYVDVRNPFQPKLVSRIYFEDVDAILFCTKNPIPIVDRLKEIEKPILFHVTLTPYGKEIEPNVPSKKEIIEAIKKISSLLGPNALYLRYDPVFLSDKYTLAYHTKMFDRLMMLLSGYVTKVLISFIDEYKNVKKHETILHRRPFTEEDYEVLGRSFAESAKKYGMTVQTCSEEKNLVEYGFIRDDCFSHALAFQLTGKTYKTWKARKGKTCHCVEMVDIGEYNTCCHFCRYCYANFDEKQVQEKRKRHDKNSSLLIGKIEEGDRVVRRVDK